MASHYCISFRPLPVSLQEARPAFLPPHSNSNPPREKNKNGEGAKGEGGTPRVLPRHWAEWLNHRAIRAHDEI